MSYPPNDDNNHYVVMSTILVVLAIALCAVRTLIATFWPL